LGDLKNPDGATRGVVDLGERGDATHKINCWIAAEKGSRWLSLELND
tara:strand:+ start:251 stop:391 length:141 start_codon:yes stop_codon:yes gene_type:complete